MIMFVALIGLIQDGTIPPQDRAYFLQMRNDEEKYILFCDEILSCVVGRHQWCQLSWQQPISELTTISDEAFAHLLVENSWDVWTDKAFDPEDTTDSSNCGESSTFTTTVSSTSSGADARATPLWTGNSIKAKKHCGWNNEGRMRFNRLFTMVYDDRRDHKEFETNYLCMKQSKHDTRKGKRARVEENDPFENVPVIVCCDEIELLEEV